MLLSLQLSVYIYCYIFFLSLLRLPISIFFPYTTLFRSQDGRDFEHEYRLVMPDGAVKHVDVVAHALNDQSASIEFVGAVMEDRKSTRLNSSHRCISYAVFCLKKKKKKI